MQDLSCRVWQHCDCIGADLMALPQHFLCELCRLARADPFWRRVGQPLMPPMKLTPVQPHRNPEEDVVQVADRHFTLGRGPLESIRNRTAKYQIQVRWPTTCSCCSFLLKFSPSTAIMLPSVLC